ncbi:MAG: lysophospholipid acyltransferase family protein [Janthinobacterium lividum]
MKYRIVSFLVYWFVRLLTLTLRVRIIGGDRVSRLQETGKGMILVTWHGRTMLPISRFRGRGYWAIISTSRDGEYQNQIFRRFGWQTVRGSTSARGAVQAALTVTKQLKRGATLAFTPDGPRGPSRVVQPGAIFLAQKSGSPIIPAGISAYPRKLSHSWDQYMIPRPFSRVVWIYGDPIYIPADAKSEEDQRLWADRIGAAIDALEAQAELEAGVTSAAVSPHLSQEGINSGR